jgi:hypothetical protein
MKKTGQGLSLNTVVIASIVLVVLVVLILIFTGGMSPFIPETRSCLGKGGRCDRVCLASEYQLGGTDCAETGDVCCISRIDTDGSDCRAKEIGADCSATAPDDNKISIGRVDCPSGEACWVNSQCKNNGYNCVETGDCAAGDEKQGNCRSGFVCCI